MYWISPDSPEPSGDRDGERPTIHLPTTSPLTHCNRQDGPTGPRETVAKRTINSDVRRGHHPTGASLEPTHTSCLSHDMLIYFNEKKRSKST